MTKETQFVQQLTDEDILKEFVKRFKCEGAVLIYLDSNNEFGFGRWRSALGRKWVNHIFKLVNNANAMNSSNARSRSVCIR